MSYLMGQTILIAEPCELLRIELRTIFSEDQRVSNILEATMSQTLEDFLCHPGIDLVVANQALIVDVSHLPRGDFVILAPKLDTAILKATYKHKGRGYLSENASATLLRMVLDCNENAFLIEPSFTPWVMNGLFNNAFSTLKEELLTPREREIVTLIREGVDRPTIAKMLCIAETTLKTHIKNIARKRDTG